MSNLELTLEEVKADSTLFFLSFLPLIHSFTFPLPSLSSYQPVTPYASTTPQPPVRATLPLPRPRPLLISQRLSHSSTTLSDQAKMTTAPMAIPAMDNSVGAFVRPLCTSF